MTLVVYTKSASFEQHINRVVEGGDIEFRASLSPALAMSGKVYLVHASSFEKGLSDWLKITCQKAAVISVAEDAPSINNLLAYTQLGVRGYLNSYMLAPHYVQLLRLLENGQSWFPPALISQAFDLARTAVVQTSLEDEHPLDALTKREKEVALAVCEGKTNKVVADEHNIAERTVKAHLTHIFKKLEVKDRVALVIYLNQFKSLKK